MSSEEVDKGRRRMLIGTVGAVGAVGVIGAAVPFIKMWEPSARARAAGAPVELSIGKLRPGQMLKAEWRGKPIWVLRRTEKMLETLDQHQDRLRDPASETEQQPKYAQHAHRSVEGKEEYLVLVGLCTHLGCSPKFVPEMEPQPFDENWSGGFFCPCHSSRFDLAGRVYEGVPAPLNLEVPPYAYLDDERIVIGMGPEEVNA